MRFLFLHIALVLALSIQANPYTTMGAEEFLYSNKFNSPINLQQIDVELIEAGVFFLTNQYRLEKKKEQLDYNASLAKGALIHSQQMEKYNFFDHVNRKNKTLARLDNRMNYVGYLHYQTLAENIYYGYLSVLEETSYKDVAQTITQAFINSKGHRQNLVASDVTEMGGGFCIAPPLKGPFLYYYFTQDFGAR